MDAAALGLGAAVLLAAGVEMVEALTIVMAMGVTRGWRSTLLGVGAAIVALAVFTAVAGYALTTWLPTAALQLGVGGLMLIFGLQWLRKAVLRSSGRKSLHDEDAIYAGEVAAAERAGPVRPGVDAFAFVVSFKGVFLEGVEVVFIVITFGLSAHALPVAVIAALIGGLLVLAAGVLVRGPLSRVPENTLKYGVGLLLATYGTFWAVEGLGVLRTDHRSVGWPGADLSLLGLLVAWYVVSRVLVHGLRKPAGASA